MKEKYIKDYYEQVHLKFPDLEMSDIKRILNFGFKSLYLHNVYGGDICVNNNNLWMYIGHLGRDSLKHFKKYKKKLGLKIRILNKKLKIPWDGYYYFGITQQLQDLIDAKKNKRGRPKKYFNYGKVVLYKLREECEVRESNKQYIYRVPYITQIGSTHFVDGYETDKAELIKVRPPLTFKDILVTNNNYTYGR